MLVFIFEFSVVVLVIVTIVTQAIIPAIKNQPIFPILRGRRKLETALSKTNELVEDNELREKIASKLDVVSKKNNPKGKK
jgi:hypothetical protein